MKRILFFLVPFLAVLGVGATVRPPADYRGESLETIDWVGADTCYVGAANGTSTLICSSGTAIAYGVLASGVALNQYLVIWDTNTSAGASAYNSSLSTKTIVYCSSTTAISSGGTSQTFFLKFPVPMKFNDGISIAAGTTQTGSNNWVLLYRKRTATE